jgi:hypothetical protein
MSASAFVAAVGYCTTEGVATILLTARTLTQAVPVAQVVNVAVDASSVVADLAQGAIAFDAPLAFFVAPHVLAAAHASALVSVGVVAPGVTVSAGSFIKLQTESTVTCLGVLACVGAIVWSTPRVAASGVDDSNTLALALADGAITTCGTRGLPWVYSLTWQALDGLLSKAVDSHIAEGAVSATGARISTSGGLLGSVSTSLVDALATLSTVSPTHTPVLTFLDDLCGVTGSKTLSLDGTESRHFTSETAVRTVQTDTTSYTRTVTAQRSESWSTQATATEPSRTGSATIFFETTLGVTSNLQRTTTVAYQSGTRTRAGNPMRDRISTYKRSTTANYQSRTRTPRAGIRDRTPTHPVTQNAIVSRYIRCRCLIR